MNKPVLSRPGADAQASQSRIHGDEGPELLTSCVNLAGAWCPDGWPNIMLDVSVKVLWARVPFQSGLRGRQTPLRSAPPTRSLGALGSFQKSRDTPGNGHPLPELAPTGEAKFPRNSAREKAL